MARARTTEVELPPTSYAILGLLTMGGECSGYDLGKFVAGSIGFFWTPAKSQLYAELRRLAAAGYATERTVEQSDRPDKRLYAITPAGRAAVRRWLADEPVELEPIKSTFLLKVFFGDLVDTDAVAEQIREYRGLMRGMLDDLKHVEERIPPERTGGYPSLVLSYGISYARSSIAWCDRTLRDLEGRAGKEGTT